MTPHVAAVEALLRAHPHLTVYMEPPRPSDPVRQPPYVVAYVWQPAAERTKLCARSDRSHWRVVTHSVGATVRAAEVVRQNVQEALQDKRPTVSGAVCSTIAGPSSGGSADWDQSTGETFADAVDEWSYEALPTS